MITLIQSNSPFGHMSSKSKVFVNQNPPMGLLYLSAYLKSKNIGVEKIIDLNLHEYSIEEFYTMIKKSDSIIYGISVSTETYNNAIEVAKIIKDAKSNAIIVFGGPHVTFCAEDILKNNKCVDYCVMNEGEITFYELVESILQNKNDKNSIKGIVFRTMNNKIVKNQYRELISNLDLLPFPDRDYFDNSKYEEISIQTTRGCPGTCPFCSASSLFHGKVRYRSTENVVNEIGQIKKTFNPKSFMFSDDTFTVNKKRLKSIISSIKEKNLYADFYCEARVDTLDRAVIENLKSIGCSRIQIGIESSVETSRKMLNKKISIEKINEISTLLKEYDIQPITNFILGLPHETIDDMKKTLNFASILDEKYNYITNFSICTPLPGTDYFNNPDKYGISIVEKNFDYYNMENAVFETSNFSIYDINELYYQSSKITQNSLDNFFKRIG